MIAFQCDRCGALYDRKASTVIAGFPSNGLLLVKKEIGFSDCPHDREAYDLCPECMGQLRDFLFKGKEENA